MISPDDYNCKAQGECYLTYRKRIKAEQAKAEAERAVNQSNAQWVKEYGIFKEIFAAGLHKRPLETSGQFKARFEFNKTRSVGQVYGRRTC